MTSADSVHTVRVELDRLVADFERCLAEVLSAAEAAGVNPADVRADLLLIERAYDRRLAILERSLELSSAGDDIEDRAWEFRHRRLDSFVKVEVKAYIGRVAPRPSTASVFANAAARVAAPTAKPEVVEAPAVQMMTCATCGAPRLQHVLYGSCAFCGAPLFPQEV